MLLLHWKLLNARKPPVTLRWIKCFLNQFTLFQLWNSKPSPLLNKLSNSRPQVSLHPSLVNVHIQHPPEAEVQIHQVARVQPGQRLANTEGVHSVQQRSQPGNGRRHPSEHGSRQSHSTGHENGHATTHSRQNEVVGRCFQETADGQVFG